MSAEELLLWMSARKEGSWPQFRGAVNSIVAPSNGDEPSAASALPFHQLLRINLQRLGHVEFFTEGRALRWRVAPPVLVVQRRGGEWCAIAAGARYPDLRKRLQALHASLQVTRIEDAPDLLLAWASGAREIEATAKALGLRVQLEAPAAILGSVPPVDAAHLRATTAIPLGTSWEVARFDPANLSWNLARRQDAEGASRAQLFRFEGEYERHHFLCSRDGAVHVPAQVGKFLVLKHARKKILRYDSERACLSLPSVCRPPMVIERALCLCSGRPAAFESANGRGTVHYNQVPQSIAISVASLLRQELRA